MISLQRVFLSTPLRDLPTIREQVREIIVRLEAVPLWIEVDTATDGNILQRSYNNIQEADVFIGIYASDYGEIPGSDVAYQRADQTTAHGDGQTSLPHWEYLWAMERGLPALLFVMSETDERQSPDHESAVSSEAPHQARLLDFKRLIMSIHPVGLFSSPENLAQQVEANLAVLLKSPPAPVQRFKGYVLSGVIGTGTFGVVYRAHQTAVDREVALKLLLPEHTHQPDFIRNFEAEAQLIARLEHPHIVPLFDYWRDADSTCLVMRFMRGGSVSDRIKGQPLPLGDVLRWVEQIGSALAFAHRHGVIHRDLKPDNLLLDDEGNAYLSDFGIARMTGWAAANNTISGTLAYMAPDQLKGEPSTPQTDLYSLGVVIYELLTGHHPFGGQTPDELVMSHLVTPLPDITLVLPTLSPMVQIVIERATAKDPSQRYADARAMTEAFRYAVSQVLSPRDPTASDEQSLESSLTNPYKGLRAFQEYDAGDFFGREGLVGRLIERMSQMPAGRLLAVIGPSGSGKSSVVKAGLLPALRSGALPSSRHWFITEMLPGSHPFEHLKDALMRVAIHPPSHLLAALKKDDHGLLEVIRRILPPDNETELLLVIDQFEELFTLTIDEAERVHFLNSLLIALEDPKTRLRIVLTLRADFYDKPLRYLEFGTWLHKGVEAVLPLSSIELEQSIVRPAEQVGAFLEKGLISAILQEVGDQPGILPLLQYAMTELFEQRKGLMLTFEAYKSMGGVTGALGQRAESLYANLNPMEKESVRQVFLRLITLGEGAEDTRRRVRQSEFDASALPVIRYFGEARLLTFDRDPQTRGPTVEVAHEALLRTWPRLKDWIAAARDELSVQRRLSHGTDAWVSAHQNSGFLAREAPLEQFEVWAQTTTLRLNAMERAFLDASLAERAQRQTLEIARKAHEARIARRAQNLGRAAVAFAVTGFLAIVLTAIAFIRTNQLEQKSAVVATEVSNANATLTPIPITLTALSDQANVNEARRIAALADAEMRNINGNVMAASLLSIRALKLAYTAEADEALQRATLLLETPRLFSGGHSDTVLSVAISPDGTKLLTGSLDKTAILWDITSGTPLTVFSGHKEDVLCVAFSPDGTQVLTGSRDDTAILWDAASGAPLTVFSGHIDDVTSVTFSADGRRVLTGNNDWTARLWDAASGELITSFQGPENNVTAALFSPDNTRVILASWDQKAEIWDVSSGQKLKSIDLTAHSNTVISIAISPDGTKLLTGSLDKTASLWDMGTGQRLRVFSGHADAVSSVLFSPDGTRVLTGSWDGTAALWDVATAQRLKVFSGHTNRLNSVAFSPDGTRVLTGGDDMMALLWDVEKRQSVHTFGGHTSLVLSVAYSPSGNQVLTGDLDGNAILSDANTGQILRVFSGHTESVNKVTFNASGSKFLSASLDKTAILWDVDSGAPLQVFSGHTRSVISAVFSPDESKVLTSSWDGTAVLWDVATGQQLKTFFPAIEVPPGSDPVSVWDAIFSPDGSKILTSYWTGIAILWDVATGEQLHVFSGHTKAVWDMAFSPDGSKVLTGSWDSTARLWDVETGETIMIFSGHRDTVTGVAFSADGSQVLTGSWDDTVRLWDTASGRLLKVFYGHTEDVTSVAFSPDGSKVLAGSHDKTSIWWYIDENTQIVELCERLIRDLTSSERMRYRLPDQNATCPQFADAEHPGEPLPDTATPLPITLVAATPLATPTATPMLLSIIPIPRTVATQAP